MSTDGYTPRTIDSGAVCLYFDEDTTATVRNIWARIAGAGISSEMPDAGWRPHITLAGCHDLRLSDYIPALQEFASGIEPLEVSFFSIGFFGGSRHTLFLMPTVTRELLDLHARHDRLASQHCSAVSPHYTPRGWVPHCTLALNLSARELAQAVTHTADWGMPIKCGLEAVGVVRVTRPTVEEMCLFRLG